VGEDLLYSHFSERKSYYIAIFPRRKMARGKGYYTTPVSNFKENLRKQKLEEQSLFWQLRI
jgi:hypothetical protein